MDESRGNESVIENALRRGIAVHGAVPAFRNAEFSGSRPGPALRGVPLRSDPAWGVFENSSGHRMSKLTPRSRFTRIRLIIRPRPLSVISFGQPQV